MPAFSNDEYRERELQKDARITRGGALHAASRVAVAFGLKSPDDVIACAELFEGYIKNGAESAQLPAEGGNPQKPEPDARAESTGESEAEAIANVNEGIGIEAIEECPKCGGDVWDNRVKKQRGEFKENFPDFTCKDRDGCNWAKWLDDKNVKSSGRKNRTAKKPPKKARRIAEQV